MLAGGEANPAVAESASPGRLDSAAKKPLRWWGHLLIRARTDDGRKRAQARGVRFGRPSALTAHQRQEVAQRLAEGALCRLI
jgi:hypothetical protein